LKKLLMGNEAVALGALRAGVQVAAGYPGTPSTEILETLVKYHKEWLRSAGEDASEGYEGPGCSGLIHAEWSVNEKAALEVAAGAAWAGARALVTMKQVGLNVASDPLMSLNYLGVRGGLVLAVADDPGPISSQTEQDTRRFGSYAKIAVFDPASPEEAYLMIADAFAFSEKYGRPVIFRPTTRVCHSYAGVELLPDLYREGANRGFEKQGGRWAIFPSLSYRSHLKIEEDLRNMGEELSAYPGNRISLEKGAPARRGIACGGVSRLYVKEVLAALSPVPDCRVLEVAAYPFPDRRALEFLAGLDEVLAVEELDPVIEDALLVLAGREHLDVKIRGKRSGDSPQAGENTLGALEDRLRSFLAGLGDPSVTVASSGPGDGARPGPAAAVGVPAPSGPVSVPGVDIPAPSPPARPPVLCAGCPHRASFFAVKEALRLSEGRRAVYSGDIGCYTLGNALPLDMVDTCLCMGAGITAAQGINRVESALGKNTLNFAFIGDSTFFHSGIPGIVNAVYNDAGIIVVILDNYTTAMTGSQPHPGMGRSVYGSPAARISIPAVLAALGLKEILRLNPFDFPSAREGVRSLLDKRGPRALVFEAPCVMVSRGSDPCRVDPVRCTGCGACTARLGCPALSLESAEGGKKICRPDPALCTGCGLCRHLCAFGAIAGGSRG
jgi:indolepyruvate ferredoxin oxidoreductase alpha subunit